MAGFFDHTRSCAVRANAETFALAKEDIRGTAVAFFAALIVLPVTAWGTDMTHEVWQLFVSGILGPLLLYGVVFLFFAVRAPARLDAERVAEIKRLRLAQGEPIDDLEPPKRRYSRKSDRLFSAVSVMLLVVLIPLGGYLVWNKISQEHELQNVLGSPSRHISDFLASARALRGDNDTAQKLAEERRVLIEGKDKKGGYKNEIAGLRNKLAADAVEIERLRKTPSKIISQATGKGMPNEITRLKRLIAYEIPEIRFGRTTIEGQLKPTLQCFQFRIRNVSDETLNVHIAFANMTLDGVPIVTNWKTDWGIVAQTQQANPAIQFRGDGLLLPVNAKMMELEFEINYDTIPASGIRKSYRRIMIPLSWDNGPINPPNTVQASIATEREK